MRKIFSGLLVVVLFIGFANNIKPAYGQTSLNRGAVVDQRNQIINKLNSLYNSNPPNPQLIIQMENQVQALTTQLIQLIQGDVRPSALELELTGARLNPSSPAPSPSP